jgi:3',5'-cyclic-AMP phosphodiesterase
MLKWIRRTRHKINWILRPAQLEWYGSKHMRIVQFTDTHLIPDIGEKFHGVDTYLSLKKAFQVALALSPKPDAFFVTGDIAEDGSARTYERFKNIFASSTVPIFALAGNHDDPQAMSEVFANSNIQFVDEIALGDWFFVFVNSNVHHKSHGSVQAEDLLRIERAAKTHFAKWGLVSLHHPPCSPCPNHGCKLHNSDELLDLLSQLSKVKTVVSGHLHLEVDRVSRGIRMLTSPSTFALCKHPITEQQVRSENFWESHSLDQSKQGFRTIDLESNGTVSSKVHWINQV